MEGLGERQKEKTQKEKHQEDVQRKKNKQNKTNQGKGDGKLIIQQAGCLRVINHSASPRLQRRRAAHGRGGVWTPLVASAQSYTSQPILPVP